MSDLFRDSARVAQPGTTVPPHLPPAPRPGTMWPRLAPAEKLSAALHAAAAGRSSGSLAIDHGTSAANVRPYLRRAREQLGLPVAPTVLRDPPPRPAPPPGPGVLLKDARDGLCRWPLWADDERPEPGDHLYCGAPTEGRPPYCPVCRARGTTAGRKRLMVIVPLPRRGTR